MSRPRKAWWVASDVGRVSEKRSHAMRRGILIISGLILLVTGAAKARPWAAPHPWAPPNATSSAKADLPAISTAIPTATTEPYARPTLQAGIAFPRWVPDSYGPWDKGWTSGLRELKQQTGARWVELVFTLYQDRRTSTFVHRGPFSYTPEDVAAGVVSAHRLGLKVFIVPHLVYGHGQWGGLVRLSTVRQERAWFESYWLGLRPYLQASAQVDAEQFALGNEYVGLESAPAGLWVTLIAQARSIYAGALTYNVNHDALINRSWMHDSRLTYLGVSMYRTLMQRPVQVSLSQLHVIWQRDVLPVLNRFSAATSKRLLLSEVGYKNSRDTLYNPWRHTTSAPLDPQLQANAYEAAVRAVFGDPLIAGLYFWAWSNDRFAPNGQPAAKVLHRLYLSSAA
jgi:hypothetical protein